MSRPIDDLESTAENNEVLRAMRDNDEVDYRIDPTMMLANLRKTPAERLRAACEAASNLNDFRERICRYNQ